jgi:hypothetical protein
MSEQRTQSPVIQRRRLLMIVAVVAIIAIPAIGTSYWALACPCDRVPGLYLRGVEASAPVTDWSFANKVPLCQVQVDAGLLTHALNLNCMATEEGALYLSCAGCDGKRWSTAALQNNEARLRLDGTVYPVTLTRVLDPAELDRAWKARSVKTGIEDNAPRPDSWWSFRVVSR